MRKVRLVSVLLILVLLAAMVAACGQQTSSSTTAAATTAAAAATTQADATEPASVEEQEEDPDVLVGDVKMNPNKGADATMTHWSGFSGADRPMLEEIISNYNMDDSTTGQVQLSIMTWAILDQKLTASIATGGGPDFFVYGPEIAGKYFDMGALIDLKPYFDSGALDYDIYPQRLMEVWTLEDEIIAAPMCVFSSALYYNIDMLEEAGYSAPPSTMDELWEMARALTITGPNGIEQYGLAMTYDIAWQPFIWNAGFEPVDLETNKFTMNTPEAAAYMQSLADLVLIDEISPALPESGNLFRAKKAAMYITGPWETTANDEAGMNYDVAPVPGGPAGDSQPGHPLFFIPLANSNKLDLFVEFESYWSTVESQRIWAKTGYPPIRVDMGNDSVLEGTWAGKFAKSAELFNVRNFATHPNAGRIFDEVMQNAWQQMVLGDKSAADALAEAESLINGYLTDY